MPMEDVVYRGQGNPRQVPKNSATVSGSVQIVGREGLANILFADTPD